MGLRATVSCATMYKLQGRDWLLISMRKHKRQYQRGSINNRKLLLLWDTASRDIFKCKVEVNITKGPAWTKLGSTVYSEQQPKRHACTAFSINNETPWITSFMRTQRKKARHVMSSRLFNNAVPTTGMEQVAVITVICIYIREVPFSNTGRSNRHHDRGFPQFFSVSPDEFRENTSKKCHFASLHILTD